MTDQELDLILEVGEGYRIEFKEALSNVDREITAFANASGGFIYIGISDDNQVKGISINNGLKSQIQHIASNCDPSIKIILREFRTAGQKEILMVEVREGRDKPYRCSSGFYNRIGPNAQKMNRNEIIDFVKTEGKVRFDELVSRDFTEKDFDDEKFALFLRRAGISKVLDNPLILKNLYAAEIQQGECIYHNSAVLFFAKNLDLHYFHTKVTCAIYKGINKVTVLDRKDFNRDIISNVDEAMLYLKQHLTVRYEFDGSPARKEIPELPYEALREAVINAIILRDYFEKGANVMIEIYDDRVEITSPGGLPRGLKEKDFGKVSILRNPGIADLMQRIEYIEKMGTGVMRMEQLMKDAGLESVQYEFSSFVRLVFNRYPSTRTGKENLKESLKENLKEQILEELRMDNSITAKKLSEKLNLSRGSINHHLDVLKKDGYILRVGSTKTGRWKILK